MCVNNISLRPFFLYKDRTKHPEHISVVCIQNHVLEFLESFGDITLMLMKRSLQDCWSHRV